MRFHSFSIPWDDGSLHHCMGRKLVDFDGSDGDFPPKQDAQKKC